MKFLDPLACPNCHKSLDRRTNNLACPQCNHHFELNPHGYYDLRLDQKVYLDFMSISKQEMDHYLDLYASTESAGARQMMEKYLSPLLNDLNIHHGAKILSVGCGGGWDVEALHKIGYQAWGVDNGGRRELWQKNPKKEYLSLADALKLPYLDNYFDFVFSEGVIEHIGSPGDTSVIYENFRELRQAFVNSMIRVTKPGGAVLIACPNRSFPIDFFHGGKNIAGIIMRFHSPREVFLLSYKDIVTLLDDQVSDVKALSLKNFFNLKNNLQRGYIQKAAFGAADSLFGILPPLFWRSALTPYVVVLAKKKPDASHS